MNYTTNYKLSRGQRNDKKWGELLRYPFQTKNSGEVLTLIGKSTYSPRKVLPWLTGNRLKINQKLFNLKRAQLRAMFSPSHPHRLEQQTNNIYILSSRIKPLEVMEVVCAFLLMREDIRMGDLLGHIVQAVSHYLLEEGGDGLQAFSVLGFLCTTGAYLPFLCTTGAYLPFVTEDRLGCGQIINLISMNIKKNCMSAIFVTRDMIAIEQYVGEWIGKFWTCIADVGSDLHQKIVCYIMAHRVSVQSISMICEATVAGLARILNQGSSDKSSFTLSNPKIFLDQEVFLGYLFALD